MRSAIKIGATCVVLTALFDFGFGHFVDGKPWTELFNDYNLADGRVWNLILVWIAVAPTVVRKLHTRGQSSRAK